ncbi:uncharacterized protein LOC130986164 isoform X2 [Salvia miltiorrhiza]|uniref:uncharacterized protein LOC130986164 isoform X2 n=1 Tax=Salvia miltiorrhiza TaxID=226208 RepID=UPI0025AD0D46|nr:uncharacterized protein LOC130986164 isoform X2 [Salvia miltiorrhiza]
MGCSGVPTAVFTETNLGTCLAVPASPDITADDFKIGCTISRSRFTHIYICESLNGRGGKGASQLFPRIRNYQGQSSDGYHLSGSLPLKYAFLGSNVTWFLQTHVILSNVPTHVESLRHNGAEVCNLNSAADVITNLVELGSASPEKRTKCKRKIKVGRFLKISTALCFRRKWKRKNAKKSLKRDTQY